MRIRLITVLLSAAALVLTGCSAPGPDAASTDAAGSTLRIGALGATTDTLNPYSTNGNADYLALAHIYEHLVVLRDGEATNMLAESIEPNADASEWTVAIREGATFSDGEPVTADDVVTSLETLRDPNVSPSYASFYGDVESVAKVDDRHVVIDLARQHGDFLTTVLALYSIVTPAGFSDWTEPIGSGDYMLESYAPGERIVLTAREDLGAEAPAIRRLEVQIINDPQARIDALKSGAIDFATRIDPTTASVEASNPDLAILAGADGSSTALGFEMNVTLPPFDDPKVREAMKLAVDRPALVDIVLLGQGRVGNDLVGLGLPGYNASIPQRERDLDRASTLFADAGVTALTLRTAEIVPGITRASELLKEQLAEVGVTLTLEPSDPASFYADYETLLSTPFQVAYYLNRDAGAYLGSFGGSSGFFNVSGYAPESFDALLLEAQSSADPATRTELFGAAQQQIWSEGGTILWGYQNELAAHVPGLTGVVFTQGVPVFAEATLG